MNHQDRKKFHGMDETGLINVQCSHVLVFSSVDMYLGERFVIFIMLFIHEITGTFRYAYSDFALARAFRSRDLNGVHLNVSYDSACSFIVNILSRFTDHISDMTDVIKRTRFSIDSLHIHNHLDKCMYLLAACYQSCSGHFHGVGTEQYWSENNQMGPQTRQMNPGHRHDKIIEHHGFWNWKKITRIGKYILMNVFTITNQLV